jgi:hypothetical protein
MADSARSGFSIIELQVGRQTYIAKCARCHLVVSPSAYPPAAWPQHVDSMRERSKLTDVQRNMIVQYVQAFARRP